MTSYITVSLMFLCCAAVLRAETVQYVDLVTLGVETCPDRNSCQRISSNFTERICECDSACAFYDDCCIDAGRGRSQRIPTKICMQFGNYSMDGVYVIADCPASFPGPATLRNLCRNGNASDPILSAPVTDTLSRKTYRNRYCAICSGASANSLTTWLISACNKTDDPNKFLNVSFQDLFYQANLRKWGIMKNGQFKTCDFMYDKPATVSTGFRLCRTNLVSTCPIGYTRTQYINACKSYMSVATDINGTLYRNPHCAKCNGVLIEDIKCFNPSLVRRNNKPFSFALLLDVNRGDGDLVGVRNTCGSGRKYDPFFEKCRDLVCAIPGYTMVDGKCKRN